MSEKAENLEPTAEKTEPVKSVPSAEISSSQVQADASKLERERISEILNSEAATNRQELANHFALNTNMDAETAIEALNASPEVVQADASDPNSSFQKVMSDIDNPDVGHGMSTASEDSDENELLVTAEQQGLV